MSARPLDVSGRPHNGRMSSLARFGPATAAWFAESFTAPTPAQEGAWEAVSGGEHALVVAPTGSGKTLAAFLWSIDSLAHSPAPEPAMRCRVLYVSPLKALASDVERNLRSPLVGIERTAQRLGVETGHLRVGVRTGDTPANERRKLATTPPDILITTPESLFLILTSAARAGLAGVETVIVDEIHVLAGSKRGAHLALSLERLDALLTRPAQRIGLSATVRPVEQVASFLAGARTMDDGGRPVRVVQPPSAKRLQIDVEVPVPDLTDLSAPPWQEAVGAPEVPSPALDLSGDAAGALPSPQEATSIWPHLTSRLLDVITAHRTTLVFANGRRTAERLTARLNEEWAARVSAQDGADTAEPSPAPGGGTVWPANIPGQSGAALGAPGVVARAHHGSMSREERTRVEESLKAGRLPAVVATSSLELGIDMGSIDVVVQIGAPPSVASLLQRVGRAGHQVGATSHGLLVPTHRGDLLPAAVAAIRAREGGIERVHTLTNPLDVLAQQIVAMVAVEDWGFAELARTVRRAAPYVTLPEGSLRAVLDMLAGRYPSEDFASLRARLVWDRGTDTLTGRPGAQLLAATSGGTIPDRGLFGVYLMAGDTDVAERGGRRVGELDEEMVFESRAGDTFTLGTSTWRIERITPDRVLVTPAPGVPGRLPFWKGDQPGRPAELGEALGRMTREATTGPAASIADRLEGWGLSPWTRDNLAAYLTEQLEATSLVPTDSLIVVERFRDDLGDWRVAILSPFGAPVHAPWAVILGARLRERLGADVGVMHSDDGIVLRLPDVSDPVDPWGPVTSTSPVVHSPARSAGGAEPSALGFSSGSDAPGGSAPAGGGVDLADLLLDPEEISHAVVEALGSSAHFAARFREAAARSLLLPRRSPGKRQPLWQQRQRASQLLAVASRYPDFPVVLEAVRECLQDDFDTAALVSLMRRVQERSVRVVEVTTPTPSPFARSLLFHYAGTFLYDADAPLAERRAAALTLDPTLLTELLGEGAADLADLLDPDAVAAVAADVGRLAQRYRASGVEQLADLLASHGPFPMAELARRVSDPAALEGWLTDLEASRRAIRVRIGGEEQWAAAQDAARLRDALGVALPLGLPEAYLEPTPDPLTDLVRRHARTHGPFQRDSLAARYALAPGLLTSTLAQLVAQGVLVSGRITPGSPPGTLEHCEADVLRRIRRRSLAAARADVEAVPANVLGIFAPRWHHLGLLRGEDGLLAAVEQLAGVPFELTDLETSVLPARVVDYSPALLDRLTSAGEVVWVGVEPPRGTDATGTVTLLPADAVALLAPVPPHPTNPLAVHVLEALSSGGRFFRDLVLAVARSCHEIGQEPPSPHEVEEALWDCVWCSLVTNDTLAPLRARAAGAKVTGSRTRTAAVPRVRRLSRASLLSPALAAADLPPDGPEAHPRVPGTRVPGTPTHAGSPATAFAARVPTPPSAAGRWSLVGERATDPAARGTALVASLLERHGVVLRTVAQAEGVPGGFAALYPTLTRLEDAGVVRRGYLVEGQGAAQFALPECVDRLRADAHLTPGALVLAATDPANPYGSLLPWPAPTGPREGMGRPRRVAGADVVLVDGVLALFLERGGGTLLSLTDSPTVLSAAVDAIASVAPTRYSSLVVRRIDGENALTSTSPLRALLTEAGFAATPRGLRLRPGPRAGAGLGEGSPRPSRTPGSTRTTRTSPYPGSR